VYALRWDGSGFVLESSSPVLPGHSRVWAARDRVYVVSEEQGVVWNVLDDDLAPVGAFEPLVRPVSLIELEPAPHSRLLALDTAAHIAGYSADRLLEVAHPAGSWSVLEWSYLAPGRPSARMVAAPHTHTAFVLHKLMGEGTIELGKVSTQAPAAPDFHVVLTGAGKGSLQALVYDTEQRVVVAVLASTAAAKLALVPTTTGRAGALVPLDAPVPGSRWWSRMLVRDGKSGRIVVATQGGLRAFSPGGSPKAPALVAEVGFAAPDLRGPIALAE